LFRALGNLIPGTTEDAVASRSVQALATTVLESALEFPKRRES
jgi:hypothetical protein